jgi:hypothetical protein
LGSQASWEVKKEDRDTGLCRQKRASLFAEVEEERRRERRADVILFRSSKLVDGEKQISSGRQRLWIGKNKLVPVVEALGAPKTSFSEARQPSVGRTESQILKTESHFLRLESQEMRLLHRLPFRNSLK